MQIIGIQTSMDMVITGRELLHKPGRLLLTTVMLALACEPASAQWMAGTTVEAVHNDNVTRSPLAGDIRSDNSMELGLWRSLHVQLADYTALELQGNLSRRQFQHYAGLSSTNASANAELSHKLGLGAEVPVVSFTTGVQRSLYNDGNRDQWLYSAGVGLRQRVGDAWQWSFTASYEHQDGDYSPTTLTYTPDGPKPGHVWNLESWQLALKTEWDLTASSWLTAGLSYRDGDIVATTHPGYDVLEASSDVAPDATFGNGMIAYRMAAATYTFALDWNHAIGEESTFYFGTERQWSHGANNLAYRTGIIRAGFLHNF